MALGKFYSVKPTAQRVGDLIELRTQVKIFQALVGSQPTPLASLRTATVNNLSLGCRLISDLSFEIGRNFPMAFFTEPTIMPAKAAWSTLARANVTEGTPMWRRLRAAMTLRKSQCVNIMHDIIAQASSSLSQAMASTTR